MASVRYVVPLEVRAKASVWLEKRGPSSVFEACRTDPHVAEVRWLSGDTPSVLLDAVSRTTRDFNRSADPATGLALIHLTQALVLSRLDGNQP